jgi:hypothetical protein
MSSPEYDEIWVRLDVSQSFFHCPKYIRTMIDGLTTVSSGSLWRLDDLVRHQRITGSVRAFLEQRVLCFLCTANREGQCAINHRGGKAGFLLTQPTRLLLSRGEVLLPDYEGNGAFEAVGNVLETGQAALIIPDYGAQLALCIAGRVQVIEAEELPMQLREGCKGAKRVIRMEVQRIEGQEGDWSTALNYERERSQAYREGHAHARECVW